MGALDAGFARRRREVNKVRIREIGRRFGLATRETSLLVLELVDDYVRNEIEPPPSLRAAYDRLAATMRKNRAQSDAARLAQVVRRFEARVAWWNRELPEGRAAEAAADRQASPAPAQSAKCSNRASARNEASADGLRAGADGDCRRRFVRASRRGEHPPEREKKDSRRDASSVEHLDRTEACNGQLGVAKAPARDGAEKWHARVPRRAARERDERRLLPR